MIFSKIAETINSFKSVEITDERKEVLKSLTSYIQSKMDAKLETRLNFICTHNSRRSHLSQVWAQAIGSYFGYNILSYSGGTEVTALFPMVAKTLEKSGFKITKLSERENPVYCIKYAKNQHPIIGFSKKYDNSFNPSSEFAAILTCSNADVGCPFIAGAEKRIPITFEDPKAFDDTPLQAEKYLERSLQIGTELFYVFSKLTKNGK